MSVFTTNTTFRPLTLRPILCGYLAKSSCIEPSLSTSPLYLSITKLEVKVVAVGKDFVGQAAGVIVAGPVYVGVHEGAAIGEPVFDPARGWC